METFAGSLMDIGEKLRKIREMKGFSQEYIASALKITQNAYSKMERGETKISEQRLQDIAKILEVPKESIEGFSDKIFVNVVNNKENSGNIKIETTETLLKHYEKEVERFTQRIAFLEQKLETQEIRHQEERIKWMDKIK
jgi:transcriptional regulator with XRE-family HTH domain